MFRSREGRSNPIGMEVPIVAIPFATATLMALLRAILPDKDRYRPQWKGPDVESLLTVTLNVLGDLRKSSGKPIDPGAMKAFLSLRRLLDVRSGKITGVSDEVRDDVDLYLLDLTEWAGSGLATALRHMRLASMARSAIRALPLSDDGTMTFASIPFGSGYYKVIRQTLIDLMIFEVGEEDHPSTDLSHLLEVAVGIATYDRYHEGTKIRFDTLLDLLPFRSLIERTDRSRHPDMSEGYHGRISDWLWSLPGFAPERGYRQDHATLDMHERLARILDRNLRGIASASTWSPETWTRSPPSMRDLTFEPPTRGTPW